MGRSFNGSYAEYALLPEDHVFSTDTDLLWEVAAVVSETYFTAWGSLFGCLQLKSKDALLVRGGIYDLNHFDPIKDIYTGHLSGADSVALAGIGLAFLLITLIAAFTFLFGTGGTPLFSIARGAGEEGRAEKYWAISSHCDSPHHLRHSA